MKKALLIISTLLILISCGKDENTINTKGDVKVDRSNIEFSTYYLKSYDEEINGESYHKFSVNQIDIKKGENVRLIIENVSGKHDFIVDELEINKKLYEGTKTQIEFLADKVGEFVYYCSEEGHRKNGQWGVLNITE